MNAQTLSQFLVLLCVSFSLSAQRGIEKQADKYYEAGKFTEALELYNQIQDINEHKETLYKRGVANYYTNHSDQAIQDFMIARNLGYDEMEIYYYTGKSLHDRGSFEDAAQFYKNYLRFLDDQEEEYRIVELIKQCNFGVDNQYNEQLAFVENLGPSVNTEYEESHPIQSPTSQNKYYFSSNRSGSYGGLRNADGYKDEIYGSYSADMYAVELTGGNWTPVTAFHAILNGPKHDLIQGFNSNGSVMYFIQSQNGEDGKIFADTFALDKDPELFPKIFSSPFVSELGDKDLQVFNDNTILFASKRTGGFGGFDLYVSERKDGIWGEAINLGPSINTRFDEVSPFLSKSGSKLYFSTDRVESFGGFDIYSSDYSQSSNSWSNSSNLGVPINSPKDDLYFSLSSDGMTAVFSSNRADSNGGLDIYLAYFKNQVRDQLLYTESLAFLINDVTGDEQSHRDSNSKTKTSQIIEQKEFYNSPLYYGSDEIVVNAANSSKLESIVDLMSIFPELEVELVCHSLREGMREFDLYFSIKRSEKVADYLVSKGIAVNRIHLKGMGSNFPHTKQVGNQISRLAEKNNRRIDVRLLHIPKEKLKVVDEWPVVSEGLKDGASDRYYELIYGLTYKVKVASTKQMYKADVIRRYNSGIVEKRYDDDSYTYTIGVFDRYSQIRILKGELLRAGVMEAKVIPYVNGLEISMEQVDLLKEIYPDLLEFLKFEM